MGRDMTSSHVGMNILPLCRPMSSAVLTVAKSSTALAISNSDEINVLQVLCFISPKHQSGANLVCPANKKL